VDATRGIIAQIRVREHAFAVDTKKSSNGAEREEVIPIG
jgi:hypothetical protein